MNTKAVVVTVVACLLAIALGILLLAWGVPVYHVWEQGMAGQARLREAESSRQILVEEARAKQEAAKALAVAEVERAKGVAEANRIIGESLQGREEYLRYLWISNLQEGDNREVIYVPTETGLPILEATRLGQPRRLPPVE